VLRAPELDAGLQGGSYQSGAEGQNHLPRPAGHTAFDAARDTVDLLGCENTLLAQVQLFIPQYPEVLLDRAALNCFIRLAVLILRVAPAWAQDLVLGVFEPLEVHTGPLLELVQVPVDGILSLRCVDCSTQLGIICKLAEGALNPAMSLMNILNTTGPNTDPQGTSLVTDIYLDIELLTITLWM